MTAPRIIVLVAVITATALTSATATAQTPQPTLSFEKPCYSDAESMAFTGTGYTPLGEVALLFGTAQVFRGSYSTRADASGAVNDSVRTEADKFLRDNEEREVISATANDRTRVDAKQQPIDSQFAGTVFTFTRWFGVSPGQYVPGRRVRVEAFGWSFAAGETLYFLFRKGTRTVASVRAGRLRGDCGDLTARIRVPRTLKAGRYRVVLSTSRRGLSELYTYRAGRVVARGAGPASRGTHLMSRVATSAR